MPSRRSSARLNAPVSTATPSMSATTATRRSETKRQASSRAQKQHKPSETKSHLHEATATRPPRERKPRSTFTPTGAEATTRKYRRRQGGLPIADGDLSPDGQCRRLEARVRSSVKQLRYLQTFVDAYEAEGWRRASREKLKPNTELARARRKIVQAKRSVVNTLNEMETLRVKDPPIPYLIEIERQQTPHGVVDGEEDHPERIYCSRCSLTETTDDNDILLCDNEGCYRAFHQQCQSPVVRTEEIPQGDEPWFCPSCLAIFNALKAINYACGTTFEKIGDVFPDLAEEEQILSAGQDYDASTAEGTAEETEGDALDDDEDDEDFTVDARRLEKDESDVESSDSDDDSGNTSADEGVIESEVSDDELKHLHVDAVIDSTRRSMRSKAGPSNPTVESGYLGDRVAKLDQDGATVFGVVVEHTTENSQSQWRVVYSDDTMECVDEAAVLAAKALAIDRKESHVASTGDPDEADQSLIIRGKRKRNRVDYRALNDLMFAGKEDSDVGDDEHVESDSDASERAAADADDEDFALPAKDEPKALPLKRGRRERPHVDYRAMHEGL